MLEPWIESDLYSWQGKTVTSLETALPQAESDLARDAMRDPYNFDFLLSLARHQTGSRLVSMIAAAVISLTVRVPQPTMASLNSRLRMSRTRSTPS
jgi:hypothetical protein